MPFFAFAPEGRRIVYATSVVESQHMQVPKFIKTRRDFPNDEAPMKLIYLALRNITQDWKMPRRDSRAAMTHFAIHFEGRYPPSRR